MSDDAKIKRIQALLAKAERTDSTHEAEALFAKAQHLMTVYAIEEIEIHGDKGSHEKIVTEELNFNTPNTAWHILFLHVGEANNVSSIKSWSRQGGRNKGDQRIVVGRPSDIAFTKMLYASLMMHCERQLSIAREVSKSLYGGKAYGQSFRMGYVRRIKERLEEAKRSATEEAMPGTALVLYDRLNESKATLEANFKVRTTSVVISHGDGYATGKRAANSADLSGGRNNLDYDRKAIR
jgi:hypothetical protein